MNEGNVLAGWVDRIGSARTRQPAAVSSKLKLRLTRCRRQIFVMFPCAAAADTSTARRLRSNVLSRVDWAGDAAWLPSASGISGRNPLAARAKFAFCHREVRRARQRRDGSAQYPSAARADTKQPRASTELPEPRACLLSASRDCARPHVPGWSEPRRDLWSGRGRVMRAKR
jgi:hypothetical protein